MHRARRTSVWALPFWCLAEVMVAALIVYFFCFIARWRRPRRVAAADARPVLLVHGFSMNDGSLWWLASRLAGRGHGPVVLVRYAWLAAPEEAISRVVEAARELAKSAGVATVDVVAHSLGGVLVHMARRLSPGGPIGRIVTLGSIHRRCWYARLPLGPMAQAIPVGEPTIGRPGDLAITSDADFFVLARWAMLAPPARTHVFDRVGHAGLVLDPRIAQIVADHLAEPIAADDADASVGLPPASPDCGLGEV